MALNGASAVPGVFFPRSIFQHAAWEFPPVHAGKSFCLPRPSRCFRLGTCISAQVAVCPPPPRRGWRNPQLLCDGRGTPRLVALWHLSSCLIHSDGALLDSAACLLCFFPGRQHARQHSFGWTCLVVLAVANQRPATQGGRRHGPRVSR